MAQGSGLWHRGVDYDTGSGLWHWGVDFGTGESEFHNTPTWLTILTRKPPPCSPWLRRKTILPPTYMFAVSNMTAVTLLLVKEQTP